MKTGIIQMLTIEPDTYAFLEIQKLNLLPLKAGAHNLERATSIYMRLCHDVFTDDIFCLLITFSFPFWYVILRIRSSTWWRFYFRGKKCPRMCLKINLSVKTLWHRPSMGVTRFALWVPVESEYKKLKYTMIWEGWKSTIFLIDLRVEREIKRWFLDVLRADVSKISAGGLH